MEYGGYQIDILEGFYSYGEMIEMIGRMESLHFIYDTFTYFCILSNYGHILILIVVSLCI